MDKHKLLLPISILLGCIVLGGFFFATQVIKQRSIEKQQQIELRVKIEADRVKAEQDAADKETQKATESFNNNLKCQTLLKDLKQRWNNVVGIYYSDWQNTCIVKYTEKGETEESPIEYMQDTN
jgi:hypothetical protein